MKGFLFFLPAIALLSFSTGALAGPFDPPPALPPPSTGARIMPPMPPAPEAKSLLSQLILIGKINQTEVYYHAQTHCYIHVKDGVIDRSPCFGAVNNWLLNHSIEPIGAIARGDGKRVN